MRITNSDLEFWFRKFNRQYFDGKLNVRVRFSDLSDIDAVGTCHADEIEIDISAKAAGLSTVLITLLHEMVHVELYSRRIKPHGTVFQNRIHKLYLQGAYKDLL